MFSNEKINELCNEMKKYVDYPISTLMQLTNLGRTTVSKFYNGHHVMPSTAAKLYTAGHKYINKLKIELEKNKIDDMN